MHFTSWCLQTWHHNTLKREKKIMTLNYFNNLYILYIVNQRKSKASLHTHAYDLFFSRLHILQILLGGFLSLPSAPLCSPFTSIFRLWHTEQATQLYLSHTFLILKYEDQSEPVYFETIQLDLIERSTRSNRFTVVLWVDLLNIFFHLRLLLI